MKYKKAISPVVATALLLVVAVVAVVGFQNWFSSYSSSIFSNTEIQSGNAATNTQIDSVFGTSLYFKNGQNSNLTITSVKINGVDCNISTNANSNDITEINISLCATNLTTNTPEAVVYTNKGIFTKKFYAKDAILYSGESVGESPSSLNCSTLVGGEWIAVIGNPILGTSDFCVMKYEAKNNSNIATSQASLLPWANISQINARNACQALGSGYDLITNAQWMTIARLIENDTTNWADGVIGSTIASSGGLYRGNVHLDDSVSCGSDVVLDANTDGINCLNGIRNKRTHNLSGQLIWDLSGNIMEYMNDTIDCSGVYPCVNIPYDIVNTNDWIEYTAVNTYGQFSYDLLMPINAGWNSSHGIGRIATPTVPAVPSGNIHVILRSGSWYHDYWGGLFMMDLSSSPFDEWETFGFRCVYNP